MTTDETHDPRRRSWLASANAGSTDFPIQNLPYGAFREAGSRQPFRIGVAIGDEILDLAAAGTAGLFRGAAALAREAAAACSAPTLNGLMALGPAAWQALRGALVERLDSRAPAVTIDRLRDCLRPQAQAEFALPVQVGDYTDFYTSIAHATTVGRNVRPQHPLTPNFRWMPIAYHGRASTLMISGTPVRRPNGQRAGPASPGRPATAAPEPVFGPSQRLDYELELGTYVGTGNPQGEPVPLADAGRRLFGMCLLNDWSARDIQFWETTPLGPFLGKNFATSLSPWVVTMAALAPFRDRWPRRPDEPAALPYLADAGDATAGALDIRLEAWLQPAGDGRPAHRLSTTSFRHQHWTVAQMLAHHTVGGCAMRPGDLFGSGTISGPTPPEGGCLMELSDGGRTPLALPGGDARTFLQDGDTVTLTGWCERDGFARIGFGRCTGTILPARP